MNARLALVGASLAVATWGSMPAVASASEPDPAPACAGFACLPEEAATAVVTVGVLTLGIIAGRGFFG